MHSSQVHEVFGVSASTKESWVSPKQSTAVCILQGMAGEGRVLALICCPEVK